jgi:hypothetical protein
MTARSAPAGWQLGLLLGLGFLAASWAWREDGRLGRQIASLVYPLDTFSMYATTWQDEVSIPLLIDKAGHSHWPYHLAAFACTPIADADQSCARGRAIGYHDDELLRHVRSHPLPPGQQGVPMQLVRRHWKLTAGQVPKQLADCPLQQCLVVP